MAAVLFKIREPDNVQQDQVYKEQKEQGKSEVYAKAFASKIHEGEVFASYFAELRYGFSERTGAECYISLV